MLRCPKCAQTSKGLPLFNRGPKPQPVSVGLPTRWIFKQKAVLIEETGKPVDLAKEAAEGTRLMCVYCRATYSIEEWQAARRRPAAEWDEEEELAEITSPSYFGPEDVKDEDDLEYVHDIQEDPYGGDDDGSDD